MLFTGDVRLTQSLGVQVTATIPDVTRSAVVAAPDRRGPLQRDIQRSRRHIGDRLVPRPNASGCNITLNGGVSLPTGPTSAPRFRPDLDDDSLVPVSRLQRGSGTLDPLVGLSPNRVYSAPSFRPAPACSPSAAARVPGP